MSTLSPKRAEPRSAKPGRVTLVGAGPGDAELLTLKAVRVLQSADVIVFDALVSDEVLDLARSTAKKMLVGKRGGRPSCRQEDINALMIKLARQGKHVVRLKSGDPGIFGRGGEEIAEIENAGIAVDIVPGVTSASAMAARLGISLTHRDHAQSVRFVTGHSRHGGLADNLDWQGLADAATTLLIYMGGRTATAFAARLIENGLGEATPVVAVASVSRTEETIWSGTLSALAADGLDANLDQPVIIGVGAAFGAYTRRAQSTADDYSAPTAKALSGGR